MSKKLLSKFEKKMGFTPEIMSVAAKLDPKMGEFYKFCDFTIQEGGALSSKMEMLMIMVMGAQRHCKECVFSNERYI